MILESEIRNKLHEFASGDLALWDFYEWIEDASWDMLRDSEQSAIDLAGDIKLLFAELDRCHISERVVADGLRDMIAGPKSVIRINVLPLVSQSARSSHFVLTASPAIG